MFKCENEVVGCIGDGLFKLMQIFENLSAALRV
jgi:hypothetical protein